MDRRQSSAAALLAASLLLAACSGNGSPDANNPLDLGPSDSGTDSGPSDLGAADQGPPDLGESDLGEPDLGPSDLGAPDLGSVDLGSPDMGPASCVRPEVACNQACVELRSDPMNCGQCGFACGASEVCSSGYCVAPPMTYTASVAPFMLPGTSTTASLGFVPMQQLPAMTSSFKRFAIDPAHNAYLGLLDGGQILVSRASQDLTSFEAPSNTGIQNVARFILETGPPGIAYILALTDAGSLVFSRTTDAGANWSSARLIDLGPTDGMFKTFGLTTHQSNVYIAGLYNQEVRLYSNPNNGDGAFVQVTFSTPTTQPELKIQADPILGDVYMMFSGTPTTIAISRDQGASVGAPQTVPFASPLLLATSFLAGVDALYTGTWVFFGTLGLYKIDYDTLAPTQLQNDPLLERPRTGRAFALGDDGTVYEGGLSNEMVSQVAFERLLPPQTNFTDATFLSHEGFRGAVHLAAVPGSDAVMVAYEGPSQIWLHLKAF